MTEEKTAMEFYKTIVQALRASGIKSVLVTIDREGRLEADVYIGKSPLIRGDKTRKQHVKN